MNEKELRHLSKTEMLEIMLEQESEVNALKERIRELDSLLSERSISIKETGSIADALWVSLQKKLDDYYESKSGLNEASAGDGSRQISAGQLREQRWSEQK